ncbi:unnamed protein product [Rotaria magnacalcarata]|uniref:Calx-beta domain-containing protein n=9 Tax=Rotaria magnacalcarata TaxID=392030 RepID=A0A816UDV9_9BILA|nr:unnamed protein product [Rotaria magnacalcarata]CAF1553343.1 unnamed protein product [Rotaria magnacalcarata]CAF2043017.1 unnamed protein product [Rotaria magnacalcarata]CAF2101363.1 unnamed protein product [Rotaria magnacalcarata]CAF3725484.1 unnamed protein product [Rotaria magnacalcarata]
MYSFRYLSPLVILFTSTSLVHGANNLKQYNNSIELSLLSSNVCSKIRSNCTQDGLVIPLWQPQDNISTGDRISRAIVYLLALIYLFIGVAIISDRFMASIEVITSQKREIRKKNPDGTVSVTTVAIWNETVSNLTLMALGSSAPEILLSIIEVVGKNFHSGDLGPGTIVGSAAFNLFVIIAICIMSIPTGEIRRIRHQRVFFVTTAWSIFAYIWLWAIVAKISPGYIEVWEGTLTFLFFPLTVFSAYIVDTKVGQFIRIRITERKQVQQLDNHTSTQIPLTLDHGGNIDDGEQKSMMDGTIRNSATPSVNDLYGTKANSIQKSISGAVFDQLGSTTGGLDETTISDQIEAQRRQEFINIWRELRKQHPNTDTQTLNDMAAVEMMNRVPKSRAYYRIQATKRLGGGGNVKKKLLEQLNESNQIAVPEKQQLIPDTTPHISKIRFEPSHYTVLENAGYVTLHVLRTDGNLRNTVYVDYMTEDGTATHGADYEPAEGTLIFYPMETHKQIQVKIIDDEIFEEDEHFSVKLSNLKIKDNQGRLTPGAFDKSVQLVEPSTAIVMIIDDDHSGMFVFDSDEATIIESDRFMDIKVLRTSGARGRVRLTYTTEDETAVTGRDYVANTGEITFENNENEKTITIEIIDRDQYHRNETFLIRLGEPLLMNEENEKDNLVMTEEEKLIAELGKPKLGDKHTLRIRIRESKEFKNAVDKALYKANTAILVGTSTWLEQFKQAFSVKDDDDDDGNESGDSDGNDGKSATCKDYMLHYVSFFWKFLFAFVPPTSLAGGWVCFVVSIIIIGLLTAVIGDLATQFGCTIGLTDTMTAIAFVALGTSLPDTFASKVAAEHDKYADSSIGNVNGSNAVNVFLGIGLPWAMSAWYHFFHDEKFVVEQGSLAFSVTVFCSFAAVAVIILMIRRLKFFGGGELGGPFKYRAISSAIFFSLWIAYLILSGLENYCHINV